jgi:hypothetical protein
MGFQTTAMFYTETVHVARLIVGSELDDEVVCVPTEVHQRHACITNNMSNDSTRCNMYDTVEILDPSDRLHHI